MRKHAKSSALVWSIAAAGAMVALTAAVAYAIDINRAYQRIRAHGEVITSPFGDIEFSQGGAGPDVLVVHGSAGGYDQGELIARTVLGDGFHWIAPSRFGYLRSGVPPNASFDDQADAYAFLLDRLGIRRVAVVALSHGGPSALLFAARYPERVSSLTLISCGVTSASDQDQQKANEQGSMLVQAFRHDLPFWLISKALKRPFMGLMGASDAVVAGMTVTQRAMVEQLIDEMNPASARSAGVQFDNTAALPGARIAAIRAPTLIFHAADDTLQLFRNAEFAAALIPGAELVRFESGGHLVLGIEQTMIRSRTQQHIRAHSPVKELPTGAAQSGPSLTSIQEG
jgi:pimeloyl-ACP methyl ester carboxylesterase